VTDQLPNGLEVYIFPSLLLEELHILLGASRASIRHHSLQTKGIRWILLAPPNHYRHTKLDHLEKVDGPYNCLSQLLANHKVPFLLKGIFRETYPYAA
jgi:hypothetical protein